MDTKDKLVTLEDLKVVHDEVTRYTTCSTAASTAAKTAALTNFVLTTGSAVKVKFTNTNTAANPTLNINSTGAKPIMQYGTTVAGTTATESWDDGAVVEFVYDGTNWVMQGRNTIDAVSKANGGTFGGTINIDQADGTTSVQGWSELRLGNNKATGTAGNSAGNLQIYGRTAYKTEIIPSSSSPTANRVLYLPDASGTIALQNSVIEGTSFTGMTSVPQYPRNVMETIRTDIASYSNGIYNVASSGGPMYFAHIGKYNNNYWAAMLQTYTDENIYFVQYANGACKVRIISQ